MCDVGDWCEATTAISGTTGDQELSVESIVAELIETNGYTYANDNRMAFVIYYSGGNQNNSWWGASEGAGTGGHDPAELTIVYTAAAGGGISIPIAMHYYKQKRS